MPRLATITIYCAVFGIALFAGLLIATVLLPRSLPTASFTNPTDTPEQIAVPSTPTIVQDTTAEPRSTPTIVQEATAEPRTATTTSESTSAGSSSPVELNIALSTTTTIPTPAQPTPTPTRAPATPPRPPAFTSRIFDKPTDTAVICGTAFESRIWGVVKDRSGRGIYRAVVQISSADGKHRYSSTTNNQGGFEVPGLGCTNWTVRLASLPRAAAGFQAPAVRVSLNGGRYSGAGIEFRQR